MTYKNTPDQRHDTPECLGVLLVNLGTPDAPTVAAVRRYLAEFLWDPRVVELPRLIWWLILHAVILRVRPPRTARAYQAVWTAAGSPLLAISKRQAAAVQRALDARLPGPVRVALGMRYGNPSIPSALAELRAANARRILVLPLYPQYSATTTASAFDAVTREISTWRWLPELRFVNQYHNDPGYIAALASSIRAHWAKHGEPERLLLSFHGIPMDYFLSGDPYHCHCQETARLLTEQLGLVKEQWILSFQSRFGTQEWLQPYTDETLKAWGAQGVRSVQVISPGFSADCLETIEEISVENRDYFLESGGESYGYIPCLNDHPEHIEMLAGLVERHGAGWPELARAANPGAITKRLERAQAMGAAA
ncbi:MAG TPA: ferrochelatase [Lamprocystis sp. (in: g-proteobacteria)]|nr:ferrochelatase [Lamprocystis sp. (in: g-proteobacteria)]